ncbi:MAG: FkbM family methyltransferase [Candidatus Omnitrophota bacterium]|nr:MAG: FkbM family methyltransferase [Candidatus Omnitrophota bacterium]
MIETISKLKYAKVNSLFARKILGLYYKENKIYTIPFGPLRKIKMRYHTSINFHVMLGLWELDNFEILQRVLIKGKLLRDNAVMCDVGANIGTYSLWFAKLIFPRGVVYAFEPSPTVVNIFTDNISINDFSNIQLMKVVCSDRVGNADFFIGYHHHTSSLQVQWAGGGKITPQKIVCEATTLDHFFYHAEGREGPDLIKMDIEGGATLALKGAGKCLRERRPLLLIESHSPQEDCAISTALVDCDYHAYRVNNRRWVKQRRQIFPHPDGVWGTLLICPAELRTHLSQLLDG